MRRNLGRVAFAFFLGIGPYTAETDFWLGSLAIYIGITIAAAAHHARLDLEIKAHKNLS